MDPVKRASLVDRYWQDRYTHPSNFLASVSPEEMVRVIKNGLSRATPDAYGLNMAEVHQIEEFLIDRPHLFFPFDIDEYRTYNYSPEALKLLLPYYHNHFSTRKPFKEYGKEVLFRQRGSGKWCILFLERHDRFPAIGELFVTFLSEDEKEVRLPADEFIATLLRHATSESSTNDSLAFNTLWVPPGMHRDKVESAVFSGALFRELKLGRIDLSSLHWRQLEELIAELLKQRGFRVNLGPGSHDGGRDIVASGEFFPGHDMQMAVQVKHRPVVNIDEVAATLYRNYEYPIIMMATSGRFASGVIQEQRKEGNRLRLILQDGLQLRNCITGGSERIFD